MQTSLIDDPRWQIFLQRVHRDVVPLGVRERLQSLRLLSSLPVQAMRAGLASLLATTPTQWERIAAIYDACFPPSKNLPEQAFHAIDGRALTALVLTDAENRTPELLGLEASAAGPGEITGVTGAEECSTEAARRQGAELRLYMLKTLRLRLLRSLQEQLWKTRQLLRLLPTWWWPLLLLCLLGATVLLGLRLRPREVPLGTSTVTLSPAPLPDAPLVPSRSVPVLAPLPAWRDQPTSLPAEVRLQWTMPNIPPLRGADDTTIDPHSSALPYSKKDTLDIGPVLRIAEPEQVRALPDAGGARRTLRLCGELLLLALLVGLPFSVLGLRWWWLPPQLRSLLPNQFDAQQERAMRLRRDYVDLPEAYDLRPVYVVPTVHVAPLSVLEDSANLLGRLYRAEHGIEIDVASTLAATLESGGRLQPIYTPRRVARELLVFIDVETGSYPLLEPFLRVLDYWERIGVPIIRLSFQRWPGTLFPSREMRSFSISEVARSHETAILLVFSRKLQPPQDGEAARDWLEEASAWPLRAWLDADPRTYQQRSQMECYHLETIEKSGLLRFPFSKEGLLAVARFFAAEGIGVRPPPEAALPSVAEPAVAMAVEQLAVAAALVPDPTWDQIDHFRRLLPGIEAALPTATCVYLLLAYLAKKAGEDVDGGHGYLNLPPDKEDELVRELRAQEPLLVRQGYKVRNNEELVRRELVIQLGDGSHLTENSLEWWFWYLRRGLHLAVLEPKRMPEIYRKLLDSPVAPEARELIERELKRRPGALPEMERWLGFGDKVLLSDLWGGSRQLWRRALSWGATASAAALFIGGIFVLVSMSRMGLMQRFRIPNTYSVAASTPSLLPKTPHRPALIVVRAGVLRMGSLPDEPGRSVDEQPHRVIIRRPYALAATEITETQFARVMEQPASESTANQPKTSVTWQQAWEYCSRLSRIEGLSPCAPPHPARPQSTATPTRCSGYRLPSEAEWEYAARAGSDHVLSGADNADDVAWYAGNSKGVLHPVATKRPNAWAFFDLSGNASEWTATRYFAKGEPTQDGIEPTLPNHLLVYSVRGGSARSATADVGIARRTTQEPQVPSRFLGFRVARDAAEKESNHD